jgi:LysM repeat protein
LLLETDANTPADAASIKLRHGKDFHVFDFGLQEDWFCCHTYCCLDRMGYIVSTCRATTTKLTLNSTTVSGATPTPTGCTGTMYTIRSGDTCQSVAAARGISVAGLLTANGLQGFCANFPTSGALCIPTSGRCKTYTVKTGDTCAKIADAKKKAWVQIVSWNPVLGKDCGNLGSYIGYPICVSTPGGDWVNPSPVPSTSEATTP